MHGTTVATNAVLTGNGAKVGLLTSQGYESILQVARSFCPGGLGGWVSFVKGPLLAPLELTYGIKERTDASGKISIPLDEDHLREQLAQLKKRDQVEALTISFVNSYINGIKINNPPAGDGIPSKKLFFQSSVSSIFVKLNLANLKTQQTE